jgi:hypothetical protein
MTKHDMTESDLLAFFRSLHDSENHDHNPPTGAERIACMICTPEVES